MKHRQPGQLDDADQADALAASLEADAAAATGRTADRIKGLAATIKGRTARLR